MLWLWIVSGAAVAVLLAAYVCFYLTFYVSSREKVKSLELAAPPGKVYEPYHDIMINWMKETRAMPHQEFSVTSFDGLTLRGKYYEYAPGAPVELMFHGYRGNGERDMCGGVQRCFALGRSALIVDQRASGRSGGNVISFGINEHRDCHCWLTFMVEHFGPEVKIILTGVSMGASTVLMAANEPLPKNVIGILADCGYSSQKEIIKKVIRQIKLPVWPVYPLIRLGARLFGHFDLEEFTPEDAMKKCTVPVIFFHAEADNYVPCYMSKINYDACPARKQLHTVPDAGHCLCCVVDPDSYISALKEFFSPELEINAV